VTFISSTPQETDGNNALRIKKYFSFLIPFGLKKKNPQIFLRFNLYPTVQIIVKTKNISLVFSEHILVSPYCQQSKSNKYLIL